MGSLGGRVECSNGRAEEIDESVDRATRSWNSGPGIRMGSIAFIGKTDERLKAGGVPVR
jgi:hypothetical protein